MLLIQYHALVCPNIYNKHKEKCLAFTFHQLRVAHSGSQWFTLAPENGPVETFAPRGPQMAGAHKTELNICGKI